MKRYILNGNAFKDLNGFIQEFSKMVNNESGYFGKDLDSFDDCLFGGYGLENPCIIIWENSSESKKVLDYEALLNWCKGKLEKRNYLDEDGFNYLVSSCENAKNNVGPTLFDQIVDRIESVKSRSNSKVDIRLVLK